MVSLWGKLLTCRTVIVFTALTSNFQINLAITIHIAQFKPRAQIFTKFKPDIQIARLQVATCSHRQNTGGKFPSVRELESLFHVPCILMFHSIEKLLTRLVDGKNVLSVRSRALPLDIYERCTDVLFCTCQTMTFGGNLAPSVLLFITLDPIQRAKHNISQSRTQVKHYPLVKEIFTRNTRQSGEMPLPPSILEEVYIPSC